MASTSSMIFSAVVAIAPLLVLQGCGGGGDPTPAPTPSSPTPKPTPVPPPTPTASPTPLPPHMPPKTPQQAAKWMNEQWFNFDENNDKSPLGISIHMAPDPTDFFKGVFCSSWQPPGGRPKTKCYNGFCDCRLSAALYNKKMIITEDGFPKLMGKPVGVVLNQAKVELDWAKCSFPSDGGSSDRYHNGCGCHQQTQENDKCKDNHSAYSNICPSTGKTCTPEDSEVKSCLATPYGPGTPPELYVIPDVAMNYIGEANWTKSPSHLRDMAKLRLQTTKIDAGAWNEVVLDERLFLSDLEQYPSDVILAIVYPKSIDGAKELAINFAKNIAQAFGNDNSIPVVVANDVDGDKKAPFEALVEETMVV